MKFRCNKIYHFQMFMPYFLPYIVVWSQRIEIFRKATFKIYKDPYDILKNFLVHLLDCCGIEN